MAGIIPTRAVLVVPTRALLVAALLSPLGLLAAAPAAAQGACGPEIRITPGDTLSRIAANCRVPSEVLRRANPGIDWNLLRIGARVVIPGGPGLRPPPRGDGAYVIERGDTLRDVARALGVSVDELLDYNPGLSQRDLVPGREIRIGRGGGGVRPPALPDIDISVAERSVSAGGVATVTVEGLPPRVPVLVRAGPEGGRAFVEARGRTGRDGSATLEIDVPDRARRGERWFVEAIDPRGRPVARDGFRIASGLPRGVTVSGLLTREGIECPALRSADGDLYTLAGRLDGFRAGDSVTVRGTIAERSICQQGTTIEIDRIEEDR